jgi:hypothetical protein
MSDRDALLAAVDLQTLLVELTGIESRGHGYPCPNPSHEQTGRTPPVSVSMNGGYQIWHCHPCDTGGTAIDALMLAHGLDEAGAFEELRDRTGHSQDRWSHPQLVATYTYVDEQGGALFEVGRFEPGFDGKPKSFVQRQPGRSDWRGGIEGVRRVPYRLPELIAGVQAGKVIYVVEGEKNVDDLRRLGLVATCNPGGAGKWRPEFTEYLRGAKVAIVADKDKPGRRHAIDVVRSLEGVAAVVRIGEAAEGCHDVSDHLAAGHGLKELVAVSVEELESMVEAATENPLDGDWLTGSPMDPCAVLLEPLPTLPGFPFMHAAMAAMVSGPTGRGRSSFVQACAYDAALKGLRVLYLGGEVTEDEFNARAALIAEKRDDDPEHVRSDLANVRYLDLRNTLELAWKKPKQWLSAVGERYHVVIVDPLGDAIDALELEDKNEDYRRFYGRLIEPLRKHGTAVVMLDNIGHAEDARNRPRGASSKMDKADLMFSCVAQDDPGALRMTLRKRRTVRSSLRVGDAWECDEATQTVKALGRAAEPSAQEREHDARVAAVEAALTDKPQSELAVVREASRIHGAVIPRTTVQRILTELYAVQEAAQVGGGWVRAAGPQEPSPSLFDQEAGSRTATAPADTGESPAGDAGRPRDEEKREKVLAALSDEPQSERTIAELAGVPRSTAQRILGELAEEGEATQTDSGWVAQNPVPTRPPKGWAVGTPHFGPPPAEPESPVDIGDSGVREGVREGVRREMSGHPPEGSFRTPPDDDRGPVCVKTSASPPARPVADLTDDEVSACREATPPPSADGGLALDPVTHPSPLEVVQSGRPCPKHPDAGRWRFPESDFWLCLACYPTTAGPGVVIEPSDLEGDS